MTNPTPYPVHGASPWDTLLKTYIDSGDALAEQAANLDADVASKVSTGGTATRTALDALYGDTAADAELDADIAEKIALVGSATQTALETLLDPRYLNQDDGDLDTDVTELLNTPGSSTATKLSTTYVKSQLPQVSGRANGLLYNGNDETATINSILSSMAAFGGGQLTLEGLVRCDSQVNFPESGSTSTARRMGAIRITGGSAQFGPGTTFTEQTPKANLPGFDLRYAGRTDAGCSTTTGSTFITNTAAVAGDRGNLVIGAGVPDKCWILASIPGSGWVVTQMMRATSGSVSLTSFGGRMQAFHYGRLELDHLQFTNNGTASSAPFGISTGPSVDIHDCVFEGASTKGSSTCDEDPWVFGGFGQGTYLTSALTSGNSYTSLPVAATPCDILAGMPLVLNFGGGTTQTVTTSSPVTAGSTTIPVGSFTANANYGINTGISFTDSENQSTLNAWNVPSAPFQGYASHVRNNQFYRIRRILAGLYTTDLYIHDNAWMHNCGSNWSQKPSTLTTGLTAGTPVTSLSVTALDKAVLTGDTIQIEIGDFSEVATASAPASAGATSISINSLTPVNSHSVGAMVFNVSAGLGAAIESFADTNAVNTLHIHHNRLGMSGQYNYATRFMGATIHSVIDANNFQDVNTDSNVIAGHRFDPGATNNCVIPGLKGGGLKTLDDRSNGATVMQAVIEHDGGIPSRLPTGLALGSSLQVPGASWAVNDTATGSALLTVAGTLRQWAFKGPVFIDGNSGGSGSTNFTIGNNSTSADAQITLNPPAGANSTIQFKLAGVNRWQFYNGAGNNLFLRDMVNGVMAATFVPGSGTAGQANFAGIAQAVNFRPLSNVPTFSATQAFDQSVASIFYLTMTGNITSWSVTNPRPDCEVEIHFIQDATGSRTLAGASGIKWAGGAPTLTTTPNKRDIFKFRSDGVGTMWEIGRSMNVG